MQGDASTELTVVGRFLATTDPFTAYGGTVQFSEQQLRRLAATLQEGEVPGRINHDDRYRLPGRLIKVELRATETGSLGLWVEHEVPVAEANTLKEYGGMSPALAVKWVELGADPDKPFLGLYVDAGYDPVAVREAAETLQAHFRVSVHKLFQFSELPALKAIIELTWATLQAMTPSIFAAMFYDGLKSLLPFRTRPQETRPATFVLKTRDADGNTAEAILQTSDPEMLKLGLQILPREMLNPAQRQRIAFDDEQPTWNLLQDD